jgi:hypothetical protein
MSATIIALPVEHGRPAQHKRDARALLAFSHMLSLEDAAFASRMAEVLHAPEEDRLRLLGLCIAVGRARFREGADA